MTLEYREKFLKHRKTCEELKAKFCRSSRDGSLHHVSLAGANRGIRMRFSNWITLHVGFMFIVLFCSPPRHYADDRSPASATTSDVTDAVTQKPPVRLRVVVLTDFPPIGVVKAGDVPAELKSDPDDLQSMVRFLLYANEFDIEGLMATAGTFANKAKKQNILDVIDRYEEVYENLRRHDPLFPHPDQLKSVTFQGRDGTWGKPWEQNIGEGKDSEASNKLITIVDRPDSRPVYLSIWGDCSVVAQAIWRVQQTRSAEELETFLSKLRLHQIATQDGSIGWLRQRFPQLFIIHSEKTYFGMFGDRDPVSDLNWVNLNIRANHGPLCAVYPPEGIGCTGVCEGDSPSFLWLVSANRGLNNPDDPTQESWGGQFRQVGQSRHFIEGPGATSISKWRKDFQREFAERANWCVK